jgi:putative tryptophan/tyrosine transport system substrate-binding protein
VKILLANSEPSTHDPKRTFGPEDVAQQNSGRAPIPSIANPCCNRVLIGVVPALGKAMRRRDFIKGIAGSATVWPLAVLAQQGERVRRIGMLMSGVASDPELQARVAVFVHGLQQLGWTEGANIRIDIRWGAGDTDRFRRYAAELVALAPDVILAGSGATMSPLMQATHTVPIVFVVVPDPVGAGFVASLERPGGNATGFMLFEYSMSGKWLELLKQIAPQVTRAAILRDPSDPAGIGQFSAIQIAAPSFGIEVRPIDVRDPTEIERGIAAIDGGSNGGLIVTGSAPASVHRNLITTLAAKHLLPTVCAYSYMTTSGCLISYGPNLVDQYRRAASYVDRILKGEKAAELPVQAPTKYELVINLKTAKALGLSIPQSLLARADEVIE